MIRSILFLGLVFTSFGAPLMASIAQRDAQAIASGFHAECNTCNWRGSRHDDYQAAANDANWHVSANHGHSVQVVSD